MKKNKAKKSKFVEHIHDYKRNDYTLPQQQSKK